MLTQPSGASPCRSGAQGPDATGSAASEQRRDFDTTASPQPPRQAQRDAEFHLGTIVISRN